MGNTIIPFIKYILILLTYLLLASLTLNIASAEAPVVDNGTHIDSVLQATISIPKTVVPTYKQYALTRVIEEWSLDEWESFNTIVQKESSWNNLAQNPHSTAFGTFQFLNSTWKSVGCVKTIDQNTQVDCGIKYIKQRYGTPSKALQHHKIHNWY